MVPQPPVFSGINIIGQYSSLCGVLALCHSLVFGLLLQHVHNLQNVHVAIVSTCESILCDCAESRGQSPGG